MKNLIKIGTVTDTIKLLGLWDVAEFWAMVQAGYLECEVLPDQSLLVFGVEEN